ncbi:MAG: hypothetical protein AAFN74_22610 [Myxococcota bacterium]
MAVKPPRGPDDLRPPAAEPTRPAKPNQLTPPTTTPARLTHDANFYRAQNLRDDSPDFADILDGAPTGGTSLGDLLPAPEVSAIPISRKSTFVRRLFWPRSRP